MKLFNREQDVSLLYYNYPVCRASDIFGLWEYSDDDSEHEYARWDFKDDGTFMYYTINQEGEWELSKKENCVYFVSGGLLATRWSDENGNEHLECWYLMLTEDGKLNFTAFRPDEDGETELYEDLILYKVQ